MSNLDPRIEAVRQQYGLAKEDFWQIPQNKQWVCKHAALEVVATKADVIWEAPQIIQADTANGIAVIVAAGKMGQRTEWATGEASPKNNKNSYPWAMAEKRAKDRVVLKLVGIHGLVYSEDEADDFKEPRQPANDPPTTKSSSQLKKDDAWTRAMSDLEKDMLDVKSSVSLDSLRQSYMDRANSEGWTAAWKNSLEDVFLSYSKQLHKDNLWSELINIKTLSGLQSFWADSLTDIKQLGPDVTREFTAKKDEMKKLLSEGPEQEIARQTGGRIVNERVLDNPLMAG